MSHVSRSIMIANDLYAQTIMNFQAALESLRDHPDFELIQLISTTANADPTNLTLCQDFAFICIAKLINVNTRPNFKRPILYAIDAILKKMGLEGPYPIIFARLFAEHGPAIFRDIPNHERQKADFLLGTWGERNYFPPDLLVRLRELVQIPVSVPVMLNQPISQHVQSVQPIAMMPQVQFPAPRSVNVMNSNAEDTFQFAVHNEMIALLNQLYSTMNVTNPLSLEQIKIQDPNLFEQLRKTATESVSRLLRNSRNSTPSGMGAPNHVSGLKRSAPEQAINPTKRGGRSRPQSDMLQRAPVAPSLVIPSHPPATQPSHGISSKGLIHQSNVAQSSGQLVKGYLCEKEVYVDVERTKYLTNNINHICNHDHMNVITPNLKKLFQELIPRMQSYLVNVMTPPPLPLFLHGPLPREPMFKSHSFPTTAVSHPDKQRYKIPIPPIRIDELKTKFPERMIRMLYLDRPFQYSEDGLRFKTEAQMLLHKDVCVKRLDFSKKKRKCREWYCDGDDWVTDFNALTSKKDGIKSSNPEVDTSSGDQFVVPVDEDFPRCPISREPFERFKDEDDGEDLYRDAVKVLVTPRTPLVFEKAHPLGHMMDDFENIRYLIVHKKLVMDKWLLEGKSATLDEVLKHPQCRGFERTLLKRAAGDEQDDDEIFVAL